MRRLVFAIVVLAVPFTSTAQDQVEIMNNGSLLFVNQPGAPDRFLFASDEAVPAMPQVDDEKNPWLAFALSFLIPGAGQYYNGQYAKGTVQFLISYVGLAMALAESGDDDSDDDANTRAAVGAWLYGGGALWSVIDAPVSANRINRENRQSSFGIYPAISNRSVGVHIALQF